MRTVLLSFFVLLCFGLSIERLFAQNALNLNEISVTLEKEGRELFLLEKTAWMGSDILHEVHKNPEKVGGYFSYRDGEGSKCVFFSKEKNPNVIASVSFDADFTETKTIVNLTERSFFSQEKILYEIRKKALSEFNTDSLFKTYSNSSINIMPMIYNGQRKVYILTSPLEEGVLLFGNDYEIRFDKDNNIVSKEALHKGLIPISYEGRAGLAKASVHSHVEGKSEFITVTDICTLMLYQDFIPWHRHYVLSSRYVSVWNCKSNSLTIITREEFDKLKESGL